VEVALHHAEDLLGDPWPAAVDGDIGREVMVNFSPAITA